MRLADIATAADRIATAERVLEDAERIGSFEQAAMAFDALLYRLLVIGEAVKALPAEFVAAEPSVPWSSIARLRDLLAHHYFRVDSEIIRHTIDAPLAELVAAVERLRRR
jgi:uncharacterized protein with HEPN domain